MPCVADDLGQPDARSRPGGDGRAGGRVHRGGRRRRSQKPRCRSRCRAALESVLESLLFAGDRPLSVDDLKKLVGERAGATVTAALEALRDRRAQEGSGIIVVEVAGGWHLRTRTDNQSWVSRLVAGKPQRLTRAMLETLSIVAYRQPITRPEIDDVRGVDCGPVLKTLLDRGLVRMIGKKDEVGRPILYGTTAEFLRIFGLKDLGELPTLREFHELNADDMAKVDAQAPLGADDAAKTAGEAAKPAPVIPRELDPGEDRRAARPSSNGRPPRRPRRRTRPR